MGNGFYKFENTRGIKNRILCIKYERYYGKQLIESLNRHHHDFVKALKCDLNDEKLIEDFFSQKVGVVLEEIKKKETLTFLSKRQVMLLFVDFIIPVAYGQTELHIDAFVYLWIINACKYIWHDVPQEIKESLYEICYSGQMYKEKELSEEEKIYYELEKYPEIKNFFHEWMSAEENLVWMLKYRNKVPSFLYAHCVRSIYIVNSHNVKTETLHDVFDGLRREELMSKEEMKIYEKLPELITIYRGTDAHEIVPRVSWTLDKDIANKYCSGQLFEAKVTKDRIMAYFDTQEKEVLIWLDANEIMRCRR